MMMRLLRMKIDRVSHDLGMFPGLLGCFFEAYLGRGF